MTDQITDQDRRDAIAWARAHRHEGPTSVARVILATVEPPALTLAEELQWWENNAREQGACVDEECFHALVARAEQMERELSEARDGVERLTEEMLSMVPAVDVDDLARAEVERLTAERDEARSVADEQIDLHDEASAARAEAEAVAARHYEKLRLALADARAEVERLTEDMLTIAPAVDVDYLVRAEVERLTKDMLSMVPAPRVITTAEELEKLAPASIIREAHGWPGLVTDQGNRIINGVEYSPERTLARGPVMVLWEPEEEK